MSISAFAPEKLQGSPADDVVVSAPDSPCRLQIRAAVGMCLLLFGLNSLLAAPARSQSKDTPEKDLPGYYFRTLDGVLLPVSKLGIPEEKLNQFVQSLGQRQAPPYELSRIVLTGRVEDSVALLEVVYTVRLSQSERWISVPLGLDECRLAGAVVYEGDGKAVFDAAGTKRTGTRRWFLLGGGPHELTFPIVASLRNVQHLRHRLQLSVPDAASTQLTLEVPHENISASVPRGSGQRVRKTEDGTQIEVWGLGPQFFLQWDVRTDIVNAPPLVRSQTAFTVDLSKDPFSITARQTLIMQQGSQQNFSVRIPPEFSLRETDPIKVDPTGTVKRIEPDPASGHVRVELARPLTDRLVLSWKLSATNPTLVREWTIGSFGVDGALEQVTDLVLTPPEGIVIRETEFVGVQRSRSARGSHNTGVQRVRLLTGKARLTVGVEEMESFVSVVPRMQMRVAQDRLRLECRFQVRVLRGSVKTLKLVWPGFSTESWKLVQMPPEEQQVDWIAGAESSEELLLDLIKRQSGTFEVTLVAVRAVDDEQPVPFSLPVLSAQTRKPATLTIIPEDQIDSQLRTGVDTTTVVVPTTDITPQAQSHLIRSEARNFEVSISPRERELSLRTTVSVMVREQQIDVEQTLRFRADFGDIADLRLKVPAGLRPTVTTDDGTELRPAARDEATARYQLPELRRGQFDIIARYRVPLVADTDSVQIPLLTSADSAITETRIGMPLGSRLRGTLSGNWTALFSREFDALWQMEGETHTVELKIDDPGRAAGDRFSVTRALIQSVVAASVIESRASFVVRGKFPFQRLLMPDDVRISSIAWNGQSVPPTDWRVALARDGLRYLTVDRSSQAGQVILTIDFRSSSEAGSWGRNLLVEAPSMPDGIGVDDLAWQVIFPSGEHLAHYQAASLPCFRWKFSNVGWQRQPTSEFTDVDEWLHQGTTRRAGLITTGIGNSYMFRQSGTLGSIRLYAVDQALALLLGAGTALLTGFGLMFFTPRRMAVAVPLIGLIISVIALRYSEFLELLLQPAVIGLLLALAANWFDRRRHRRGFAVYRRKPLPARSTLHAETAVHQPAASGSRP